MSFISNPDSNNTIIIAPSLTLLLFVYRSDLHLEINMVLTAVRSVVLNYHDVDSGGDGDDGETLKKHLQVSLNKQKTLFQ